ncbi:MAG TPA: hypothetical protein VF069_17870 [Streptosporangiaceae bacterium]
MVAFKTLPLTSQPRPKTHKRHQQKVAAVQPPRQAAAPQTMTRESDRLPQGIARSTLRLNGIRWRSTGHCSNRYRPVCTSLDHIRRGSVDGLIAFKRRSGCRITVSGGTERGHAHGRFSHWNGYKIDVVPNRCVDRYITNRLRPVGIRGDGAEMFRAPSGAIYADEKSHWDLLFR